MISKGSRLGVGSLIRGRAILEPQNGKWSTCASFFKQLPAPIHLLNKGAMGKQSWSDEGALQALKEGQERGLDYYFGLYYAPLTYFAFKLLEDQYLAEEIASEAFVKLWNHREQLSGEGSIKAWLYSAVRNASIDHLRKAKRLRVNEVGLQTPDSAEQSVLHRMIHTETIQQVIRILELLPPKCSQVFKMFYFQGKTHEEIACELNLSPHTVRNQRIRAVRLLKEKITPMFLWLLVLIHAAL